MVANRIFVTDFDGTICRNEFYQLARDRFLGLNTPNFWEDYTAGRVTHFEALRRYFAAIRAEESAIVGMLENMDLDPQFGPLTRQLIDQGWEVVVASAGCGWYIHRLLDPIGVSLTIHANPGEWRGGDAGLAMEPPTDSPFFCPENGIDKSAIVRDALRRAEVVIFAGDGMPDVPAARLLPEDRRFARGDCAAELRRWGEAFRPFDRWSEVALTLLAEFR